ncbi:uncharacterized protein LOC108832135 isoform X2 [Raphanus sativus]|uniref:Uncharacterized protein LOC108832135 isoform X2 n=1 Tax=Raphanus sativus TaxID=3726 RepID=A0A9W3DGJ9_RAPSA|nr:uncharacterized protein LOC108832135 isoform X2 [Raphanus sativus]
MPNFPGGCTSADQFSKYVYERVRECILRYMSKEATATHLQDRYQIPYGYTERAWCYIEKLNQDFFRTYFENGAPNAAALAKVAKQTVLAPQIKEETGSCKTPNSPPKRDSDKAPDTTSREKEEQLMEFVRNLLSRVPEEAAHPPHDGNAIVSVEQSSSKAGGESQAIQKPKLETSQQQQQQPLYPTEFWKKLLTTLGQIESNTDKMVKLMSDGHGFASAVGSSKRQRDEQRKDRGDNDEAEKLQDQNSQQPDGQSRGNKAAKKH